MEVRRGILPDHLFSGVNRDCSGDKGHRPHTNFAADWSYWRLQSFLNVGKRDLRRTIGHDRIHRIHDVARYVRVLDFHYTPEMPCDVYEPAGILGEQEGL